MRRPPFLCRENHVVLKRQERDRRPPNNAAVLVECVNEFATGSESQPNLRRKAAALLAMARISSSPPPFKVT